MDIMAWKYINMKIRHCYFNMSFLLLFYIPSYFIIIYTGALSRSNNSSLNSYLKTNLDQ